MKVILSAAISLDGYLDDLSPERLKLSSDEDWAEVKKLRARCDAILVGAETVRKDNPSLVIRDARLRDERISQGMKPDITKITITRKGNLSPASKFFTEGAGSKIIFTCQPTDPALERAAEIITMPRITAKEICTELESRGYRTLMVEGGSMILSMFLSEGIVDEFRLAIAPFFVGEEGAPRLVQPGHFIWNAQNRLKPSGIELLGDTTVIHLIKK